MVRLVFGTLTLLMGLLCAVWPSEAGERAKNLRDAAIFVAIGLPFFVWGVIAVVRKTTAAPLRWWKLAQSQQDLLALSVPASAQIQYLIWFLVIELFSWGVNTEQYTFGWQKGSIYGDAFGVATIIVKVIGPILAYRANGGSDGQDFLLRFFTLSFPIRVRSVVLILLLAAPAAIVEGAFSGIAAAMNFEYERVYQTAKIGFFWLAFNMLHYVWLSRSMRELRRQTRRPPVPAPLGRPA